MQHEAPVIWNEPLPDRLGSVGPSTGSDDEPVEWWRADRHTRRNESIRPRPGDPSSAAVPFWSLMAFTGVALFSPQNYFPALATFRPALLVIGVGIGAYVLDCWARRTPIIEWTKEMKLMAALLGWVAASIPFSMWPGGSVAVLLDYLKVVVVFGLLSHVIVTKQRLRQAAWLLTWMAVGLGFFVVYNYVTGAVVAASSVNERVMGNEGGLTKNPNDMALMINLFVPLTVALLLREPHVLKRHMLMAALAIEGAAVVLTFSRGGAVTLGGIFLLYVWKLRRRPERSWLFGLIVAGLLALPLAPSSYFERLSTITNVDADRTGSAQERWSDMVLAAKTIVVNPVIGAGVGMNSLAMNEARGGGWLPVHNVYLEHALDLGLPGLVLFVLLWKACLKAAVSAQRCYERLREEDMRQLAEALEVSLIAYAAAAMFHPVSYHLYFYYMAGLVVAASKICAATRRQTEVTI